MYTLTLPTGTTQHTHFRPALRLLGAHVATHTPWTAQADPAHITERGRVAACVVTGGNAEHPELVAGHSANDTERDAIRHDG